MGTAVERHVLPRTEEGYARLGLGREETELVRWVVEEVGREARGVLERVRRGRSRQPGGREGERGSGRGGGG